MANRNFSNAGKIYNLHVMPVLLDCNFITGSSGAVTNTKGPGINDITRLAAGVYRIRLQDKYNLFYGMSTDIVAPVTGGNIASGSLATGTLYQITAVGTTNWVTAGLPSNVTPAVGMTFVAIATAAGTGTAKVVAPSGIVAIELAGDPNLTLSNNSQTVSDGGTITIVCLGATDATTTTLIPTDPPSGCKLHISLYLSNSSITVQGE